MSAKFKQLKSNVFLGTFFFVACFGIYSNPPKLPTSSQNHLSFSFKNSRCCKSSPTLLYTEKMPFCRAILANRLGSLTDFKKLVKVEYTKRKNLFGTTTSNVRLSYKSNGYLIIANLDDGVDQNDMLYARDGRILDKLKFLFRSPYAVSRRFELNEVQKLSRRRGAYFGEGDVAFFDLAERSVANINTPQLAFRYESDSSEKGYLNTFNHITAQAIIASFYSKGVADFVANVHERYNMPELTSGNFTFKQMNDKNNYPVDNYSDMINNKIGQSLGIWLKNKYRTGPDTRCTPRLLANYMNDIQKYYCWTFQIGMKPFNPDDELIIRFSEKFNIVAQGVPFKEVI